MGTAVAHWNLQRPAALQVNVFLTDVWQLSLEAVTHMM